MRVLFWNINGNAIESHIAAIVVKKPKPDVVVLAESSINPGRFLAALASAGAASFVHAPGACKRVNVFLSGTAVVHPPVLEGTYFSIRRLEQFRQPLLLGAVHLPSKLRYSQKTQELVAGDLAQQFAVVESKFPKHHLVVIGDFNMHPYESGMIAADRLHAVSDRRIAAGGTRIVAGKPYRLFYNPSWRKLGDTRAKPGGTFYRRTNDADCVFWNMLNQVIVRPSLLPYLADDCLEVLDMAGAVSLRKGAMMRPDEAISDHLPVMFSLQL
jgi:hypothetical protein